jgi:hypothetical protein
MEMHVRSGVMVSDCPLRQGLSNGLDSMVAAVVVDELLHKNYSSSDGLNPTQPFFCLFCIQDSFRDQINAVLSMSWLVYICLWRCKLSDKTFCCAIAIQGRRSSAD